MDSVNQFIAFQVRAVIQLASVCNGNRFFTARDDFRPRMKLLSQESVLLITLLNLI